MNITIDELITILSRVPPKHDDDPAKESVWITFGQVRAGTSVKSESLECSDDSTLVLDYDKDGRVCGIEFA